MSRTAKKHEIFTKHPYQLITCILSRSLPEGYITTPVITSDVPDVNATWKYTTPRSMGYIQLLVDNFPSVCVRMTGIDYPVAWILTTPDGSMGILYVREGHRRRGLGVILVKALSEKLVRNGWTPYVRVDMDNEPSLRLFHKCGFRATDDDFAPSWIEFSRSESNEENGS